MLGFIFVFALGCKNNKNSNEKINNFKNRIVIHALADPVSLNPVNYSDAFADEINHYIFQKLMDIDHYTQQLTPVLAESRPLLTKTPEGDLQVTYRLNPKATWDNNNPITAKDVEFSLKVVLCPGVNNERNKPNFELIKDFKYYDEDPLKFTIIYDETYIRAEFNSGSEYFIIPSHIYDSTGVLAKYRLLDFCDKDRLTKLKNDKAIGEWTKSFNSIKYSRELGYIVGSGPYHFDGWKTGQEIRLKKKNNWWGNNFTDKSSYFDVKLDYLIYKIVNDQTTALAAFKSGELDLMYGIRAKDYNDIKNNQKLKDKFNLNSTSMLGYSYIGVNALRLELNSKNTRKALAHLVDINKIIKTINYGFAIPVTGPTHPAKKECYDSLLLPYTFDIKKAKELLQQEGWYDSDNNGILEKEINGKKTELSLTFLTIAGSEDRSAIANLLKNWFKEAGIELKIQNQEWSVFIQNVMKKNFDLYYGSWFGEFAPEDHTQLFHTTQIAEGSNYVNFGNSKTDALIDSIKIELNEAKRNEMYKRFQFILFDEANYIFLMSPNNNIAVSKKYNYVKFTTVYPGFWAPGFALQD
jgi:peptide/nickel transport system substrate-binding protein